jgi:electron transport complex protein RnfG
MREIIRYGLTLALICIVASASLALVNSFTKAKILAQSLLEEEASLKEVFPAAVNFESVKSANKVIYYKALDKDGKFLGVAFKASGKGYSSTIETMAGLTKDDRILAIKVVNQNETPGLGSQVAEPGFSSRFSNKDVQSLNEVQAITGATISSRAVIDSVKQKAQEFRQLIKDER